jgi:hypothetical protein
VTKKDGKLNGSTKSFSARLDGRQAEFEQKKKVKQVEAAIRIIMLI